MHGVRDAGAVVHPAGELRAEEAAAEPPRGDVRDDGYVRPERRFGVAVDLMPPGTPFLTPYFRETFESSLSAVSALSSLLYFFFFL